MKVPKTERVSYKVTQFVIPGASTACRNYLELHDGMDESSPIFGKFCSQSAIANGVTSGSNLFVKFVTDGSGSLFNMEYETRKFYEHSHLR